VSGRSNIIGGADGDGAAGDLGDIPPVIKQMTAPCDPLTAFSVFTRDFAAWWPKHSHSLSREEIEAVVFECRAGGRVFEVDRQGTEHQWGTVRDWQPGRRVVYTWHVGRPQVEATEIEVGFRAVGGATLVTLVHGAWERWGIEGSILRGGYDEGWDHVFLACYGQAVERAAKAGES